MRLKTKCAIFGKIYSAINTHLINFTKYFSQYSFLELMPFLSSIRWLGLPDQKLYNLVILNFSLCPNQRHVLTTILAIFGTNDMVIHLLVAFNLPDALNNLVICSLILRAQIINGKFISITNQLLKRCFNGTHLVLIKRK